MVITDHSLIVSKEKEEKFPCVSLRVIESLKLPARQPMCWGTDAPALL